MTRATGLTSLLVFAMSLAGAAAAESPAESSAPDAGPSPWRLGLALGYGERSNPLIQSDDVPIVVDVDVAWFGERFFFDNGDFGYTLANTDLLTASIVARVNSDRLFFKIGRAHV